ncbi:MAG: endonuclease domain-containing protein [Phascolarctobacterium sp.]
MEEDTLFNRAKKLRKNMTKQERHLWYDFLSKRPEKWYRQKILGNYIVDFYCESFRIIIEIDGSQHFTDEALAYDKLRSNYLESKGNIVIRFTNTEIDSHFSSVCAKIDCIIREKLVNF